MSKERKRLREQREAEIHTQADRERALFTHTRILERERASEPERGSTTHTHEILSDRSRREKESCEERIKA